MTDRAIARSPDRPINGVLVIDKPAGPTSHDVVARARRALREKRIGHTGTLDPMATGVLPLVIGKATRLAAMLSSTEKAYDASIRLGAVSDTYDAAGRLDPADARVPAVDAAQVEEALAAFRGSFEQMPPPYSAKKVAGVPAYRLARKQQPTELSPVPVTVHELELLGVEEGLIRVRLVTSPGFYVRSLAHDLGARLGCGAHLEALRRTRAGRFGLEASLPLEDLERDTESARSRLIPLEALVPELPAVHLNARGAERASHGNFLRPEDLRERGTVPDFATPGTGPDFATPGTGPLGRRVRVFDQDGRLIAIADLGADGLLRPSIVLV